MKIHCQKDVKEVLYQVSFSLSKAAEGWHEAWLRMTRIDTKPKTAVKGLPDIVVDDKFLGSNLAQCVVCQDDFEKDMVVK